MESINASSFCITEITHVLTSEHSARERMYMKN